MRTRSLWLLGGLGVVAAAAFLIGHSALASQSQLDLQALDATYPLGGETDLQVTVDAEFVGGHGQLYAQVEGFSREWVMDFAFDLPQFTITAPVPGNPEYAGREMTFQYQAFDASGAALGASTPAKRIIEPILED